MIKKPGFNKKKLKNENGTFCCGWSLKKASFCLWKSQGVCFWRARNNLESSFGFPQFSGPTNFYSSDFS